MADSFGGSRAIYPSSGLVFYIVLLLIVKFFRAFGLFLSYDLLKVIPVVQFLCIIKVGSVLPLVFLQKPFTSGKRITKHQWFRISRHAFVGSSIQILWLFGLTLCGPLRTILLYEHSDLVVIAWATALFTSTGSGPAKLRGAVFFLVAVIGLLLFDHDDRIHEILEHESVDRHTNVIARLFYHVVDLIGWSDHKGGVILLSITLCLQTGYNNASKKLAIEIGGAKRLHALSTISSIAMLFPLSVFVYFTHESEIESWLYMLLPLTIVTLFVFLLDYYIEAVCTNHLQPPRTAKYGTFAISIGALVLSQTWNHPYTASITTMNKLREIITEDHVLSGGVIFSLIAFMVATDILVSPGRAVKGSFIGFSPAGLPLYTFTGDALHRTSSTVMSVLRSGLRQILDDINSRKIFYFLCINLCFTFVELIYGAWTNSLGLISDGFHMLFDCSALVLGLYAAIMSRWKPSRIFPYGYDRVEVLSGFINGLFLIVIAIFVFTEAIDRMFDPPEIKTERLLTVSVLGLMVNLIGIVAFRSSHSHGHGHSHGHTHGESGSASHNTNMQGVFLHILADTLGSVGVIISSLLIENFGWNIADPVCSIFIAVMIFLSVLPLIKETSSVLMLQMPLQNDKQLNEALEKVLNVDGVLAYRDPHIWSHTSSKVLGTLHIQVLPDASEQRVISQATSVFREYGIHSVTVQVEKEAYFHHLTGLSSTFEQIIEYTKNFKALKKEEGNRVKAI